MALPSGHPQAFREKGLTQTLYLCAYLCGFAIILHYIKNELLHLCATAHFAYSIISSSGSVIGSGLFSSGFFFDFTATTAITAIITTTAAAVPAMRGIFTSCDTAEQTVSAQGLISKVITPSSPTVPPVQDLTLPGSFIVKPILNIEFAISSY